METNILVALLALLAFAVAAVVFTLVVVVLVDRSAGDTRAASREAQGEEKRESE